MSLQVHERHDSYAVQITSEKKGVVQGWAMLIIIKNERHEEPYGLLENVYVEQEHRGSGLGTKLVQAVIDEAKKRNCYKLLATSRYSKPEVHDWYMRLGFQDWGKEFRMDLIDSKPIQKD